MSLKLETEDDEVKITAEKSAIAEIDDTIDDLLSLVTENYAPFIKATLVSILQNMKKEIGRKKNRLLPKEDFVAAFGGKVEIYFISSILDAYIVPLITDFSRITYDKIVSYVTRAIYAMMVQQMTFLIITEDDEPFKPCKPYQVIMLEVMFKTLYYYLDSKRTGGIRKSEMDRESRLLRMLFKMYDEPTPQVINLYTQFTKYASLSRVSRVKDRHLIALLATRKKDGMAKKFVTEHWKRNEEQRIVSTFQLKFADTDQDILLYSAKCYDKNLKQNVVHLTKVAVCVESKKGIFNGKRGGGLSKSDLRSNKSVATTQSSRVFLTDITAVRTSSSIVRGKGLKIYFKDGVVRMFFKRSKHRDGFQAELIKQGKKLGNKKIENDDKTAK
jgi:hypothetical protein